MFNLTTGHYEYYFVLCQVTFQNVGILDVFVHINILTDHYTD